MAVRRGWDGDGVRERLGRGRQLGTGGNEGRLEVATRNRSENGLNLSTGTEKRTAKGIWDGSFEGANEDEEMNENADENMSEDDEKYDGTW